MSQPDADLIRDTYEAFARGDIAGKVVRFDDYVAPPPGGFPAA